MPYSAPVETSTAARPVQPGDRVQLIDALRGIALFGILIVNISHFRFFDFYRPESGRLVDRTAGVMVHLLAIGKFYPLFSFLFGVGFAIQMSRASGPSPSRYLRRLVALFAFGVAHSLLFARYDILMRYAVLGMLLPLFRNAASRTLLLVAAGLVLFSVVEPQLLTGYKEWRARNPVVLQSQRDDAAATGRAVKNFDDAGDRGSFVEVLRANWNLLKVIPAHDVRDTAFPRIFAIFLLGLLAWRHGVLVRPREHRRLLHALAWGGGTVGIAGNLADIWRSTLIQHGVPDWTVRLAAVIGNLSLTALYIAVVVLLWKRFGPRLTFLVKTGRMALTNYLFQSVAMSLLFCGYALHLEMHAASSLLFALGIYSANVLLSVWWLGRHRFGPMEWIWRYLTYGGSWGRAPGAISGGETS
ncbi:MAG TPA: DUF418 domain-containing protein [Chthoniobacterales bacterium]|nr:DUF418 domain-containing protein [Chthoniobacterales bacterium]